MSNTFYMMIPHEQIFISNDEMWFIDHTANVLYKGKVSSGECELVTNIPFGSYGAYRANPFCIKYDNYVMCLPITGNCILTYDLGKKEFQKIEVSNPPTGFIGFRYMGWVVDGTFWAWVFGLSKVVEINLKNRKIEAYYNIDQIEKEKFAWQAAYDEKTIYLFGNSKRVFYEFHIDTKKLNEYEIPQVKTAVNTICFDGKFFWLSGEKQCIYKWNKLTGELDVLTNFPEEFQVVEKEPGTSIYQKMLFYKSVCVGEYICFLPWDIRETRCNSVLFVNKISHQMKAIKLYGELDDGNGAYSLDYVKENRYIGIFYSQNTYISEIDTQTFEITEKRFQFLHESYTKILNTKLHNGTLEEKDSYDLINFINLSLAREEG